MQGIFLHGSRPKSKKQIKEVVEAAQQEYTTQEEHQNLHIHDLYCIVVEATSLFGNEYDGSLANAPKDKQFDFVGPDPYTLRNFYGWIRYNPKTEKWHVR